MSDQLTSDLESLRLPRDEPRRSRTRSGGGRPTQRGSGRGFISTVLALALVAGGSYGAVRGYPWLRAQVFKTTVTTAEIGVLSPVQASTTLTAAGYVIPLTSSRVASRATGRVARVRVREGDVVTLGQPLLDLDVADQRSAIAAARARMVAAQARVATARANLAEVRQQAERQRALVNSGTAPRATLEDLDARVSALGAAVTAAVAEVRAAQAEVEVQRVGLAQLAITAPIAGTVLTRPPQVGETIGPLSPALEIADMTSLVVEVDVPEARLRLVRVGGPCEIVLEAFPGQRFRGIAHEVGRRVDRAKATVPVRVRFVAVSGEVLPNMAGRVSFLTEEVPAEALRASERVVVPASAVVERNGARVVFVVEDGAVRSRRVRVGARIGEDYELLDGPAARTRVVTRPPEGLRDGNKIRETRQ